jgi:predicted alpha/beta-fold hydrolase
VGGHRQTLLGYWRRRRLTWTAPTEDVIVEAGDDVRLLVRASWQPGTREERPAVVLVHGLGSSDQASYALATGRYAWERGWHVLRMNMRGAGDGEPLCPRLYNAGLDQDLVAVLGAVATRVPRLAVVGFSLGGNLTLLALGRRAAQLPPGLAAAVAVSPPMDLAACARALEQPTNRLYQRWFMRGLRASYIRRQRLLPALYEAGRERNLQTVREFDDAITAPYGGYRDAADYYAQSSSGRYLGGIDRPTLILTAADDPMVPARSIASWDLPPGVVREVVATGGHMGFVAPTRAPAHFWAAERAIAFLEERIHGEEQGGKATGSSTPRGR